MRIVRDFFVSFGYGQPQILQEASMDDFVASYMGQLRQLVGPRLLLVPGARIIIEDAEGNILLQKRSDFGVWGLPGGNAEPG